MYINYLVLKKKKKKILALYLFVCRLSTVYVWACKKVFLFLSSIFSWYQSLVKAKREDSKQRSHWKWYKGKSSIILFTLLCNPRSENSSGSYSNDLQIGCYLHRLEGSKEILQPFCPLGWIFVGVVSLRVHFGLHFLCGRCLHGVPEGLHHICRFLISTQVKGLHIDCV